MNEKYDNFFIARASKANRNDDALFWGVIVYSLFQTHISDVIRAKSKSVEGLRWIGGTKEKRKHMFKAGKKIKLVSMELSETGEDNTMYLNDICQR